MPGEELKLEALQYSADQAVLDPSRWVDVCDRLAEFIGGVGAAIGPDAVEYQLPRLIVASPSLEGLMTAIFRDGWNTRSYRRRAVPIIKQRGSGHDGNVRELLITNRGIELAADGGTAQAILGGFVRAGRRPREN